MSVLLQAQIEAAVGAINADKGRRCAGGQVHDNLPMEKALMPERGRSSYRRVLELLSWTSSSTWPTPATQADIWGFVRTHP